jgi:hypothetical protein
MDIAVTSTHQTPAGKMIFGRIEERADASSARAAAAGTIQGTSGTSGFDTGNAPSFTGQEPQ